MKLLLIHGANLNALGRRDSHHYGQLTLPALVELVRRHVLDWGWTVKDFQSNHEGDLIDFIQKESGEANAILINPGAWTPSSYALHDALVDTGLPVIEVHLSDIKNREPWRAHSVIAPACLKQFYGEHEKSYLKALDFLHLQA
jgi:3-dehydroquinate dehydratase-2